MNLLVSLCLVTTALSFSNGIIFKNKEDVLGNREQVASFFNANIAQMKETYLKEKNIKWDAHKVQSVLDVFSDEKADKVGYFVSFDVGYLSYGKDLSVYTVDTTTVLDEPFDFCVKADNGLFLEKNDGRFLTLSTPWAFDETQGIGVTMAESFIHVQKVTTFNQFKVNACVSEIDFLKEHYPNVDYGDFFPFCKLQRDKGCAPAAFANLIYSYKLSGVDDLTNGWSPEYVDELYGAFADYSEQSGTQENKIGPAMNTYLNYVGKYDK